MSVHLNYSILYSITIACAKPIMAALYALEPVKKNLF